MPCAAALECKTPDKTPAPGQSTEHLCYGGCDGVLHAVCGQQVSESDSSEMHRMCPLCYEYNYGTAATTMRPSGNGKRKATSNSEEGAKQKKKKEATNSRVRLSLKQKGDVLDLVADKVTYRQIAERFGCAEKTVKNIVHSQQTIRKQLKDAGSSSSLVNAKASRRPQYPEVRAVRCALW